MKPVTIDLPIPTIGAKIWLLQETGLYVLERGSGVIRTDACTHGGAGSISIYDGIPNDQGFFEDRELPEHEMAELVRATLRQDPDASAAAARERIAQSAKNGRRIYYANPTVMGSWMMDGGFYHGLTIEAPGGHESISPVASIVWMPRLRAAAPAPRAE